MASDLEFTQYVCDQLSGAGEMTYRKMFGEFVLYCDGKVVALICDNRLFIKSTVPGRALLAQVMEAPPYPGAKPYFLIEEGLEERDELCKLIRTTANALPLPKPKAKKQSKKS